MNIEKTEAIRAGGMDSNVPTITHRLTAAQAAIVVNYTIGNCRWTLATGRARCRVCGKLIAKSERCIRTFTDFSGKTRWNEPHGYATTSIFLHSDCVPTWAHKAVSGGDE